jgi:DNA-binding transcriptional LysR family regulator
MISSRQLEYFRAVARELHFTRAAESLRIAQPALSQQIRKLERSLGLTLFERDNHRVRITAAGAALLDHAERILSDLSAVEAEMLGWAQGTRGRIRLGTARGLAVQLARLLSAFCAAYPDVDVELREESTGEMVADLYSGELDAATLAAVPPLDDGRLATHSLGSEPLVLVTGTDNPLGRKRSVHVAELDEVDFVLYRPGSAVREVIVSALAAAGVAPRARFETREYTTARILASAGLAVAILPRSFAEEPGHPIRVTRLDPEPAWAPSLAWSAGRRPSPALTAFLDFVIAHPELAAIGDKHTK